MLQRGVAVCLEPIPRSLVLLQLIDKPNPFELYGSLQLAKKELFRELRGLGDSAKSSGVFEQHHFEALKNFLHKVGGGWSFRTVSFPCTLRLHVCVIVMPGRSCFLSIYNGVACHPASATCSDPVAVVVIGKTC